MNIRNRVYKLTYFQNGYRSDRNLFRENQKDEELDPPLPDSEIPCGDQSVSCGFLCKVHDFLAISLIVTLVALCLSLLNRDVAAPQSFTKSPWPLVGAIACLSMLNLCMFCNTATYRRNVVLLCIYAAVQLFTRSFCVSLAFNIRGVINGEYDKAEYIMAFLCLIQDIATITLFIISLCGGGGGGSSSSSSSSDSDSE